MVEIDSVGVVVGCTIVAGFILSCDVEPDLVLAVHAIFAMHDTLTWVTYLALLFF